MQTIEVILYRNSFNLVSRKLQRWLDGSFGLKSFQRWTVLMSTVQDPTLIEYIQHAGLRTTSFYFSHWSKHEINMLSCIIRHVGQDITYASCVICLWVSTVATSTFLYGGYMSYFEALRRSAISSQYRTAAFSNNWNHCLRDANIWIGSVKAQ